MRKKEQRPVTKSYPRISLKDSENVSSLQRSREILPSEKQRKSSVKTNRDILSLEKL
jgi:hypothetical protein